MQAAVGTRGRIDPLLVRLLLFLALLVGLILFWAAAFTAVEGLAFGDAVYYTIVTVATVGYGDIHPATPLGKTLAVLAILTGTGTFGGLVASLTEVLVTRHERRKRLDKLNLVIGAFFAEVGNELLALLARTDPRVGEVRRDLLVSGAWSDAQFAAVAGRVGAHEFEVDAAALDFPHLRDFLAARRGFLLRLLENPTLAEHELFTDLLLAVFHLGEEVHHRRELRDLPATDLAHLAGDVRRCYGLLVHQWLEYLRYLRTSYPYLFSLAVRTNPFDEDASPVVTR
jgi:hypothetical protein